MRFRTPIVLAATTLLSVAVVGCGSSSKPLVPPTKAQLDAANLAQADLPAGWKGSADDSSSSDDASEAAAGAKCAGIKDTFPDRVADSQSDDFDLGQAEVSSELESYKTKADVSNDESLFSNPKAADCFRQLAAGQLSGAGGSGTTTSITSLKVSGKAAGDPAGVVGRLAVVLKVAGQGGSLAVDLDQVFIAHGLTETDVTFTGGGTPFPADVEKNVIAKLADRTAAL